jgi:hypothetical protein
VFISIPLIFNPFSELCRCLGPEGEGATYRVRAIITDHYGNVTWIEIVHAIVQPIYRVKASLGIRQEKSTKRRIKEHLNPCSPPFTFSPEV